MNILLNFTIHQPGVYTAEDFGDFGWTFMSYGILLLYHFTVLQTIGMVSTGYLS